MKYDKELSAVQAAARRAGKEILKVYRNDFKVKYKAENNPVTVADIVSNKIILRRLKQFNYGILSEETTDDKSRLKKSRVWIIDPLDGTKDFIAKTGDFSVMIALAEKGRPVLGVVYRPLGDLMYYALAGRGAYARKNGGKPVKLKVAPNKNFKEARMLISRFHLLDSDLDLAKNLGIKKLIPGGSSGLKAGLIAEKKADLYVNTSNQTREWDSCAADILIKEAGGRMTDTRGRIITYNKKDPRNLRGYAAANKYFHQAIIRALQRR